MEHELPLVGGRAMIVLQLVVLMLAALATGALLVNWIGLARAMARLRSAKHYTELHQATNQTFDPYMPIVLIGALVGGIVLVALSPGLRSAAGRLALLGVFGYTAVLAIGLPTCVRINHMVARWPRNDPPANWQDVRSRWIRFHVLRTLCSVPALACYILACLLPAR